MNDQCVQQRLVKFSQRCVLTVEIRWRDPGLGLRSFAFFFAKVVIMSTTKGKYDIEPSYVVARAATTTGELYADVLAADVGEQC